jgi:hypothetical protein
MQRRTLLRLSVPLAAALATRAYAQGATPGNTHERKPDLGDAAEGTYFGEVISDSKGSSHADVTLTVKRTGVNRVRITSDYARLPGVDVQLTRAMDKIMQSRGDTVFLYDGSKKPAKLDVSFHGEVSWSGYRR